MLDKIIGFLSGGFGTKLLDTVTSYLPASMSDADKAEFKLKFQEATHQQAVELIKLTGEAEQEFNQRVKDLEGTAKDLLVMPILGKALIFLRGCQRPFFGMFVLVMDFMVFSGKWAVTPDTRLESSFFAINILVLGFLFGERAVKNIMPLFDRYMGKNN